MDCIVCWILKVHADFELLNLQWHSLCVRTVQLELNCPFMIHVLQNNKLLVC